MPRGDAGASWRRLRPKSLQRSCRFRCSSRNGSQVMSVYTAITWMRSLSRPTVEVHNRVRALSPHIGARATIDGRSLTVWRTRVVDGELELIEVQPEGRRRMTYAEYLRGLR